jgi:CheY-like chemotaxis protein
MSSKTVLVVDDYSDLLTLLGSALTRLGWDPSLANSAAEAWKQIEQNSPRVILLDMWMEGMNGFQFAKKLKKHPVYRNIPILGTSGFAMSEADETSFRACCDDFLSKPFAISSLQQHLTALLSQDTTAETAKTNKTQH